MLKFNETLNSVSFDLKIVPDKKNLFTIDKARVLGDIKTIFINSKVTSAEIVDHCGNKHVYSDGEFLGPVKLDTWTDKPLDLPSIYGWRGSIDLKTNQLGDLVSNLAPLESEPALVNNESYGYFWKFDDSSINFRQVIGSSSLKPKLPSNIAKFALGSIVNGDCFVSHFSTQSRSKIDDLNVELVPHKNELNLMFTVIDETGTKKKVMFCYDCNSIKSVNIHHVQSLDSSFYVELSNAPKLFVADVQSCFNNGKNQIKWRRKSSCGPISRDLIGKCNVLRLTWLSYSTSYIPALYLWCRALKFDLSFGGIVNYSNEFVDESTDMKFPDKIKYLLACMKSLSFNYLDDLQINHKGEKIINELIEKQIAAGKSGQVQRALHRLHQSYVSGEVYNVFEHFRYLLNKVELEWANIKDLEKDTEHIKYIKTVVFTPSRTVFMPPVMTRTSRFLDFAETDCVLRVIYRDENYGTLFSTFNNFVSDQPKEKSYDEENVDCVTSMLKDRILKNGLCVAGRTYQYFGASPSQLKDGGMMLYAKDSQNRTAASIRNSLGIVKEKSVPKYMSRIGLSLSQVMAFVDLPGYTKIYITSDIYGGSHPHTNKPYNFTDGCGSISLEAARYIYDDLIRQKVLERKDDDRYIPSAFQIRFMGSKGMLVVDPDLIGMTIVIRESMQKMFTGKDRLGIVKVSETRRAYLNKPFIMVLNQIGLCHDFFINLTTSTLRDLNSSFYDEQVALMTMKLYTHLNRVVNLDAFANCNFSFTNDSFFQSILHLAVKQAFDSLKTKQRIPLPWLEARTMLGVCDTTAKSSKVLANFEKGICQPPEFPDSMDGLGTGVLKAGQVFCWPSDFTEPLRGELAVTKFPNSDLGGVRRLVAVDCKELHAIKDCIVFPVDGMRPHQDEMAGSDLDGDEYCVVWMEDFLRIQERIPTSYPENPKAETQYEISDELMIDHHINCVRLDQVGMIANAQITYADIEGYDSIIGKRLGHKHNGALDAPKNGFNSKYLLERGDRPLETPDFMDKWSIKPTYYSTSACGEIYRLVNLHQHSSNFLNVPAVFEPSSDIDERLLHPKMLQFITFATESLLVYESTINHLLPRYGLKLEVELFTGIIDQSSSLHNESSRFKDKEDAMIAAINSLLTNKMDELFDSKLIDASKDDKMAAASAIYYVSKQKVEETTNSCIGLPFIGKSGFYLRQYMKYKATTKNQEKTATTKAVATHNQSTIEHPLTASANCNIKDKVINIIKTFLAYGKVPKHAILAIESRIDKVMSRDDSCAVVSLLDHNLIANLLQETNRVSANLAGLKNNELNLNQFIDNTIPTLISWLLVAETKEKTTSDYINESFLVRCGKRGIHNSLWTLLEKTLAADTQIEILFESKEKNSIPVVIHGSSTSIWMALIIIGIHNRLTSIYFKNYTT